LRLQIISVGRISDPHFQEACSLYTGRIRKYANFSWTVVREERVSPRGNKDYILRTEGKRIREKLPPGSFSVMLDERGHWVSSEAFARLLEKWSNEGQREIVFVLGGPYGLSPEVKSTADHLLSLSPMTLPHGMALLVLLEQIYRAFTIMRREPYHK
jgi:23S rRNA (pseudouridine1915-N3)-methyltransferase